MNRQRLRVHRAWCAEGFCQNLFSMGVRAPAYFTLDAMATPLIEALPGWEKYRISYASNSAACASDCQCSSKRPLRQ